MQRRKVILTCKATLTASFLLLAANRYYPVHADQNDAGANPTAAPDNSQMNTRDRNSAQPTADQARNDKSDIEIMRQIRRSIVADKSLSVYAHNIKVVAQEGQVTLKGTVHTEDEKANIASKAADVVGAEKVTNRISVKGS